MPDKNAFHALEEAMYSSGDIKYAQKNPMTELAKKLYHTLYTSILRVTLPPARKAVYGIGWLTDNASEKLEEYGNGLVRYGGRYETVGHGLQKIGQTFKYLFGTETLERTSIEVGMAVTLSPTGLGRLIGNVGTGFTLWSGNMHYFKENGGIPSDYHRFLYGSVNLPVFSAYHSTFGPGSGWSFPYVSFAADPRMSIGTIGLTNFAAIHFGHVGVNEPWQYERGDFAGLNFGVNFGLAGVAFNLILYYPPLEQFIKRTGLEKAAEWQRTHINEPIQDYTNKLKRRVKEAIFPEGDAKR